MTDERQDSPRSAAAGNLAASASASARDASGGATQVSDPGSVTRTTARKAFHKLPPELRRFAVRSQERWQRTPLSSAYARNRWIRKEYLPFADGRRRSLFLSIARYWHINRPATGYYFEFGSHSATTMRMAWDAFHHLFDFHYVAFDSFEGLPEIQPIDQQEIWEEGKLKTDEATFLRLCLGHGIAKEKLSTVKGFYDESLNDAARQAFESRKAAVIYIDCDLYASTVPVLSFVRSFLQRGTVIVFDDWFCFHGDPAKGEQRAWREFTAANPTLRFAPFVQTGERPPSSTWATGGTWAAQVPNVASVPAARRVQRRRYIITSTEPRVVSHHVQDISPWVGLVSRTVLQPGYDDPQIYHSLALADYVAIVARLRDGRIAMIRQYRPALTRESLELPAGLVDHPEEPSSAARRELLEETGLTSSSWSLLGSLDPDSARLENVLWVYYAADCQEVPDWRPEPGVVRELLPPQDLAQAVSSGAFKHALHMAALGLAAMSGLVSDVLTASVVDSP